MNEDLLKPHIRNVTEEDRKKLPRFSYSRIEQYLNCPMAYDLKYNQEKQTRDTSLALELGTLLHAVLEQKGYMLRNGIVNYTILDKLITDGIIEKTEKSKDIIPGISALKKKYWETWSIPDSEGRTYDEKLILFNEVLHKEMQDTEWVPYAFEMPFEFVWDDRVIMNGFIDRIDVNLHKKAFRVIDYKTSKKPFDKSKLPTSLQFGIYALACLNDNKINSIPVEYIYRFILLDDFQKALSLGWEKRLVKKLIQTFNSIDDRKIQNEWVPRPSPLCFYCNYCVNNPNAHEFKNECDYYSLWTPDNKTFETHKEWGLKKEAEKTRKLIF